MEQIPAQIGTPVDEIDTPALVVDLDAFERNLAKMARLAREAGVRLRPHAKTHKSPAVALRQIAHGAVGQCVQKVGEAEVLVRGGVRDVLVSNEVFGAQKFRRLAALGREATQRVPQVMQRRSLGRRGTRVFRIQVSGHGLCGNKRIPTMLRPAGARVKATRVRSRTQR